MFYTRTYKVEPSKNKDPPKYIFLLYYTKRFYTYEKVWKLRSYIKITNYLIKDKKASVVYNVGSTSLNKLLNYKDVVNNIDVSDLENFVTSLRDCICKEWPILNRDHGYTVTRDLCFIGNEHLRKLLPYSIWWRRGTKSPSPTSFSSVTSTNVGIIP